MSTLEAWKSAGEDWDKVRKLSSSMESYAKILAGQREATGVLAQVMSIGLESIDPDFDIKEGSAITLRAIKEGIVAAAKAARDLLKKMLEMINSFYVKFTGSIRSVRSAQQKVSRRLGKLGSKTTYNKMSVAGVQRLAVDGEFVGTEVDRLNDIRELTNYILNVYPKSVTKISRDCSRSFLNIMDKHESIAETSAASACLESFVNVLQRDFKAPQGATQVQSRELPNGQTFYRSKILAGNVAFVYTPPSAVKGYFQKGNGDPEAVGNALKMQFSELQLNVADRSEREIDVPTVDELTALVGGISNILQLAERAETGQNDFKSVKVVVDDAIRQISEKSQGEDNSGNVILFILGEISKKLAEPMGHYLHWLAVTLNVWLTFINHCINHYDTEGV